MIVQFWPCPGCSRHVKRGEALCPFCGATASVDIGPTRTIAGRLSRAALFAAGAVGAAVATTDCGAGPQPAYGGVSIPSEIEDSSASDGPSVVVADAGDASTTTEPTDSSSASDAPNAADGPADARDADTPPPTDSSGATDAPSAVALYGGFAPPYGHVPVPDE
jgi:hypothetical protein